MKVIIITECSKFLSLPSSGVSKVKTVLCGPTPTEVAEEITQKYIVNGCRKLIEREVSEVDRCKVSPLTASVILIKYSEMIPF